jgi:hypothetical protein
MILLTPEAVHEALKEFFPAKNDDFATGYVEELAELRAFGIATQEQLRELLHRRADEVMEIDRSPMSESDIQMHRQASGEEFLANRLRDGFWFSYPALLRIAMELEFGKSYEEYAERRDGIVESGRRGDFSPRLPHHRTCGSASGGS